MYCDDCGASMVWRCTDNNTNISKFKCPQCGRIQVGKLDVKPVLPRPEPKYYYMGRGKYIVNKKVDGKDCYVGSFDDEETAKLVVASMNKVGWDKSNRPSVFKELGIFKFKGSWVRA